MTNPFEIEYQSPQRIEIQPNFDFEPQITLYDKSKPSVGRLKLRLYIDDNFPVQELINLSPIV